MRTTIKAIIFDMDGVIINSGKLNMKCEWAVCKKYKIKVPRAEWDNFRGTTLAYFFNYVIAKYGHKKLSVKKLIADKIECLFNKADKEIKQIPGSIEALKMCRRLNLKTALVTSNEKEIADYIFLKFKLKDWLDVVVTAKDIIIGKPEPEPYLKAAAKLKLRPKQCLVLEDADNGIISAKAAGCIAIGLVGAFSKEKLFKAGADYVVKDFREFNILLKKIL